MKSLLRSLNIKKSPILVQSNEDILLLNRNLDEKIITTFFLSNTTGEGINILITFLSNIPVRNREEILKIAMKENVQFDVHEALDISSKIILSGILVNGRLISDKYLLGPYHNGEFKY